MKISAVSVITLASLATALPNPQLSWTRPTIGSTGEGFNWSNYFNRPITTAPSTPAPTSTSTPGGGNTGGEGAIGGKCTPQSAGRSTENGITAKSCCTDMTVIFARGTGETGNVGTVSGPPMFKALRAKLGNNRVTVQGVDYPANSAGNSQMGGTGGTIMATLVQQALTQCPNTKIIISGYSQGAMVVHNAFRNGLASTQVAAAILFGDPMRRSAVGDLPTAKVQQFCGPSDAICGAGSAGGSTGGHLSYGSDADAAAAFAIKAAGFS